MNPLLRVLTMNEFCGCNKPNIINIEQGLTLIVECTNCGEKVATTNQRYFEEHPWLTDETKYEIVVVPTELERKIFLSLLNTHAAVKISDAAVMYKNNTEFTIFKGAGSEFYEFAKNLKDKSISFKVLPQCPSYI